ncbi:MAG: hypothetical protein M3Y80_09680 [Verrucomicrobiota bacterium]|nr:hypothetical protein [Verrucomicrobiota bacterium]
MIVVSFALPAESSGFIALLEQRQKTRDAVTGVLNGRSIAVFHTGVGVAAAAPAVEAFLQHCAPQLWISSGFAGALDESLRVGDLLLASNYSAKQRPPFRSGNLASAETVVDTARDRQAMAARTDAVAVDMETESIANVCAARGIPLLSFRVISDTPAAPLPLPPAVLFDVARQRTHFPTLLLHLARHPAAVPKLIRFAGQIATARHALTRGLELLLRDETLPT